MDWVVIGQNIAIWMLEHGIRIIVTIAIAYGLYRLAKLLISRLVVNTVESRAKREGHHKLWVDSRTKTLREVLTTIIGLVLTVGAILIILPEFGVEIGPLLAGAGIIGLAVSLAAQNLIKDTINGLLVFFEDQYNEGDVVKIADLSGTVEEFNLRRTVLRDLDGIVHTIPNGSITTTSNYTRDWARVNLDVPVAYGEDLDHVIKVINQVGQELATDEAFISMIKSPPQVLRVNDFADSAIMIKVVGDTYPGMHWAVKGEFRKRIKEAFDKEGIEIPWPHLKLYFGDQPGHLLCPVCGVANPAGGKFCLNCGSSIEPTAEKPLEDKELKPEGKEEN